ncbi:hypothetical protein PS2_0232 [Aeromonas phage PS2]|uniref:Uncharacterized protein n=1 Tax=Aeromonas phage PS1 TaxID=2591406 RepID=A0A514TUP4_9CAUD|nr:hypothetical protein PQC64_gp033 [Aeromonas phage PS1]QDJ96741.1 hypothetical protein PS1_0230 [Aeromonas phage PS1]QFR59374.1 hypothetical protein PS2_0232 [Aeromonas phage PS2]
MNRYDERSTTRGETPRSWNKECSYQTGLPYCVAEEATRQLVEI